MNICQLLDDFAADKEMTVRQMVSSRRWNGYLRRLAVCVDKKSSCFSTGAAVILRKADCMAGRDSDSASTRLPLTSASTTEVLNPNIGYLQVLVGVWPGTLPNNIYAPDSFSFQQ